MKARLFSFALAALFIFSGPAFADTQQAQQTIETFVKNIKSMDFPAKDAAKQAELIKQTNDLLDLGSMGKKALGEHWAQASADQQKSFIDLLWKLIENVAYPNSRKFMSDFQILYPEVKTDETGFQVHTVVKQQEQALDAKVVYHIYDAGGGKLKVDDVILDDVSIIEDLKYQFDKLIAKSGFPGLLDKMKERLTQAEKANSPA